MITSSGGYIDGDINLFFFYIRKNFLKHQGIKFRLYPIGQGSQACSTSLGG